MEVDLKNVKVKAFKSVVLKVWSSDPWESPKPFQGICEVKTIFIIILRHYLPFLLFTFAQMVSKSVEPGYRSSSDTNVCYPPLCTFSSKRKNEKGFHFHLKISSVKLKITSFY